MFQRYKSVRSFYIAEIYKNTGRQVKYNQENKKREQNSSENQKNVNKNSGISQTQNRVDLVQNNKKEGNDETIICI